MAILSEVLLRKSGNGVLRTGASLLDEDLASVHGVNLPNANDGSAAAPRGIPNRSITELSGLPGSGKTAIALALISETVRRGLDVLYVGCDYRSFPWDRIRNTEGWNSERFDTRIHTVYIGDIDQLLVLRAPQNTGLVVIEHYDTLIKRAWPAPLGQRAAEACASKFSMLSKECCVFVTAGCVKTELHEDVVLGPVVKIWNKPPNMARLLIYQCPDSKRALSTGACFELNEQGTISSQMGKRRSSLLLPTLSSKKPSYVTQNRSFQSPVALVSNGLLPTPATKRAKFNSYGSGSPPCREKKASRETESASSPFNRMVKQLSPADKTQAQLSLSLMLPASAATNQPSAQSYRQSKVHQPPARRDERTEPSHMRDSPLTQPAIPSTDPAKHRGVDALSHSGESFLGLEIVPNSQVDVGDPEYLLQPNLT